MNEQLRAEAKRLLPKLVDRYAAQLQLFPSGVRITGARGYDLTAKLI